MTTCENMPIFVPLKKDLSSTIIRLALNIKGVSFQMISSDSGAIPLPLREGCMDEKFPLLKMGENWINGLVEILDELEISYKGPSLFPNGNRGMPLALRFWSQKFLEEGLLPEKRAENINFHLSFISRQMIDGREYLQGEKPGLADIFSYSPIALLKIDYGPLVMELMESDPNLISWDFKMKTLYEQA